MYYWTSIKQELQTVKKKRDTSHEEFNQTASLLEQQGKTKNRKRIMKRKRMELIVENACIKDNGTSAQRQGCIFHVIVHVKKKLNK